MKTMDSLLAERDAAEREVERLRGLLASALDEWHRDAECLYCSCHEMTCWCTFEDIERIRREVGLT